MRKTLTATATALLTTVASAMPIAIVASDNFDSYGAGGAIASNNGGTGFAGAWSGVNNTTVVATVPGADDPMSGNALQFTSPNNDGAAVRTLSSAISSNVFVAFDFQFNGGVINNNDFLGLWFGTSAGPNIGLKANCGGSPSGCTADLFARTTGSSGSFSRNITIGETVSLLGYLEKVGGSSVYNRYSLWVDSDLSDVGALGAADAVYNGASSISSFSKMGFRTATLTSADSLLVDNLQIAVVPEPGSLALAGLALLGLAAARRRR